MGGGWKQRRVLGEAEVVKEGKSKRKGKKNHPINVLKYSIKHKRRKNIKIRPHKATEEKLYENSVNTSFTVGKSDTASRRVILSYQSYNSISTIYPTACVCACGESYRKQVTHCSIMVNRLE